MMILSALLIEMKYLVISKVKESM